MAGKKGAQVQLQAELNTDEDFDKFVEKNGLLVLDVYSDWCGPCTGMISLLRKIKIELGGDNLHYAIAKSDNITYLERFRNKSEPTWMFITHGQVSRIVFGANTPLLHKALVDELDLQAKYNETQIETREVFSFTTLSPEEQIRFEAKERERLEREKLEAELLARKKRERKEALLNEIATNLPTSTVLVYWPQSLETGPPLIVEALDQCGMRVTNFERMVLSQEMINEWVEFADFNVSEEAIGALCETKSLVQLIKVTDGDEYAGTIEKDASEVVYGATGLPPGDPNSIAEKLFWQRKITTDKGQQTNEDLTTPEASNLSLVEDAPSELAESECEYGDIQPGIWTPLTAMGKACVVLSVFHNVCKPFIPPEPPEVPPCLVVAFDSLKRKEVLDVCMECPDDIVHVGFFTSYKPEEAELRAKTIDEYEEKVPALTDKMIVQVIQTKSETLLNLVGLGPVYVSPNIVQAEQELSVFFPDDYEVDLEEEQRKLEEEELERLRRSEDLDAEGNAEDAGSKEMVEAS